MTESMTQAVEGPRVPRWLIVVVTTVVLLVALVFGAWYWLMHTSSGAQYVLNLARAQGIVSQDVSGSLAEGLFIRRLQFSNNSLLLEASNIEATLVVNLLPPVVQIKNLSADQLQLGLNPSDKPGGPPPSNIASPVPVAVDHARINELIINGQGFSESIHDIRLSGRYGTRLMLDRLDLRYKGATVGLEGEASLNTPFSHRLDAEIEVGDQWPELTGQTVKLNLAGTVRETRLDLDASGPVELRADGLLLNLLRQPAWNLDLRSPELRWPLADPQLTARQVELHSEGRLADYALEGKAELAGPLIADNIRQDSLQVTLSGQGGLEQLQINQIGIDVLDGTVNAQGVVSWSEGLSVQLEGSLEQLLPTPWLADWLPSRPVNGQFDISLTPDRVRIDNLGLRWNGQPHLQLSGAIELESNAIDARISWQDLQWPIAEATAWQTSQGQAQITGQLSDYRITVDTLVSPPGSAFEPITVDAVAEGSLEELRVTSIQANALGAELQGSGLVGLERPLNWSFEFSGEDFNPEVLDSRFPGQIDFQLTTRGELNDGQMDGRIDIEKLSGQLREQPVAGRGSLVFDDSGLRAEDLDIKVGDNRITADGGLQPGQGLSADVSITRLGDWLPGARGSLDGRLKMDPDDQYQLSLSGEELIWNQFSLENVAIQASGQSRGPRTTDLTATAENLIVGGNRFNEFNLELEGSEDDFQARIELDADRAELNALFEGSVRGLQTSSPALTGSLQQLNLIHQRLGTWQLNTPSELVIAQQRLQLERACLLQHDRQGSLCLAGQMDAKGTGQLSLEANELPAQLALVMDKSGLRLGQRVNAQLQWQRSEANSPGQGSLNATFSPGEIELTQTELGPVLTAESRFSAQLGTDGLLTGDVDMPLQRGGGLMAKFRVDANDWERSDQVQGWVRAELDDMTVLERLFPTLDKTAGQASIDIQVGGRLRDPEFGGDLSLREADFTYLPLGLTIANLNLDGSMEGADSVRLQGTFGAGEGKGKLSGRVSWSGPLSAEISLRGEKLKVIDSPTIKVTASPELTINWQNQQLVVDGSVNIPSADITPRSEAREVVTESPDVVLVNAPELEQEDPEPTAPFNISGTVNVSLGDEVRFDAGETQASVGGAVSLNWDGKKLLPNADGRLNLTDGRYQAYGQLLELENSSLRFNGGPVDNPRLRIEAVREIFGNAGVRKAGVRIRGTAERPDIRLFTDPPSNEETALAYVITGNDFDQGSGIGALSVGTYVLPRLYVSYGFGLFEETGNVISARYEFTRNWGVRVLSGDRDTGIDATYMIERD